MIRIRQFRVWKREWFLFNLLVFFGRVKKRVDERELVDIIYLDFQKAFDKVSHKRLLRKLSSRGVRGEVLSRIRNQLRGNKD